jgi:hypothetical protein
VRLMTLSALFDHADGSGQWWTAFRFFDRRDRELARDLLFASAVRTMS